MQKVPALEVRGLSVAYDDKPVLWNVEVSVPCSVMTAIVGPNGAGKSTLLKAVLDIVPKLSGTASILGKPIAQCRNQVGYVPQRTSVDWDFPTTVFDLVQMGTYGRLGWIRRPGKKERDESWRALELVEMTDFANRQIGELSGGQQQRAFLARAFVQDAPVYFLDEPFAGVDAKTEKAIVAILHNLRQAGKTLIVVHHDLSTVCDYFDEVILLNREIVGCGPVAETFHRDLVETTYGGPVRVKLES